MQQRFRMMRSLTSLLVKHQEHRLRRRVAAVHRRLDQGSLLPAARFHTLDHTVGQATGQSLRRCLGECRKVLSYRLSVCALCNEMQAQGILDQPE